VHRFFWLIFVVFVTGACASQATFGDAITQGEPTPIPTPIVPVQPIYEVTRGDVIDQRTYFGRISAISTRALQFSINGQVAEVLATSGQDVQVGDVLARLDTGGLQDQLTDAQERLAIAQSFLESAENQATFDRRQRELQVELAQVALDTARLRASATPSDELTLLVRQREIELELAQLALDQINDGIDPALVYDVARAQEEVDDIAALLGQAELVAAMDGRLVSLRVSPGDTVAAFTTIGLIADLSAFEITDTMESFELANLTEGLPALVQRANRPDEVYEATIVQLPQPFGTGDDDQVHVHFNTPPAPSEFELGERMSFTVTIAERKDVLWLPSSAIRLFGGRNFVVIQEDGVERRTDVRLGLEGNERVEILEGLTENQRVIAP
jgi:multidrug efflux pump subunit AcrA (membrane-fusion protein)